MRALDQFSKFCAMIAGGFAATPPSPDRKRGDGGRAQPAAPPCAKPPAPRTIRDDDNRPRPPGGSHPAVWPR